MNEAMRSTFSAASEIVERSKRSPECNAALDDLSVDVIRFLAELESVDDLGTLKELAETIGKKAGEISKKYGGALGFTGTTNTFANSGNSMLVFLNMNGFTGEPQKTAVKACAETLQKMIEDLG